MNDFLFDDDDYILINTETLELFSDRNFNKASTASTWIELLLRADENSTVRIRESDFNFNSLSLLVREGFIDIYKDRRTTSVLVVIRPTQYTDVGTDEIMDLPICARYYGGRRRSEPGYSKFRKDVLIRDNYRCCECGSGDDLEVHHIKEYVNYPKLRTTVSNGITLCKKCHKKKHKNGVRRNGNI